MNATGPSSRSAGTARNSDPTRSRPPVLVIDDEPVIVAALDRILTAEGFPVTTAPDAETALDRLDGVAAGLVVVDLKLPGLSGLDFLRRAARPDRTFVLMSGYASNAHVVESLQAGAFGFLSKPFTFEEARSVVQRANRFRSFTPSERIPRTQGRVTATLGVQSWVRLDPTGIAVLGVTDVFVRTAGSSRHVDPPTPDFPLMQGDPLVRITGDGDYPFVAWAALGGQVVAVNDHLESDPGLLARDPFGDGWVVRVQPVDAEDDLARLSSTT